MDRKRIVIIGNGIAAEKACAEALKEGKDAVSITVIGKEEYGPYPRPRLPEFLSGKIVKDVFTSKKFSDRKDITYIPGGAEDVDFQAKSVLLPGGKSIGYDSLVLCTGSVPNRLKIDGSDFDSIYSLRTIDDAEEIISNLSSTSSIVVIGAGLLGLEAALALKKRTGIAVTVVESARSLLPRELDEESASFLENMLIGKGLSFKKGASASSYISKDGKSVSGVLFSDGSAVEASIVIEAIGVHPVFPFQVDGKIKIGRGIVINECAETSIEGVYAAGDAAEYDSRCPGLVSFALQSARVAGINAAGGNQKLILPPSSTFMKVDDISIYSLGKIKGGNVVEKRSEGNLERFFITEDGKVEGAIGVGKSVDMMKSLSFLGKPFSPEG